MFSKPQDGFQFRGQTYDRESRFLFATIRRAEEAKLLIKWSVEEDWARRERNESPEGIRIVSGKNSETISTLRCGVRRLRIQPALHDSAKVIGTLVITGEP